LLGAEALVTVSVVVELLLLLKESGWRADTLETSAASTQRTIMAGRLSIVRFQTRRTESYSLLVATTS
jgi:hypothetical protein